MKKGMRVRYKPTSDKGTVLSIVKHDRVLHLFHVRFDDGEDGFFYNPNLFSIIKPEAR